MPLKRHATVDARLRVGTIIESRPAVAKTDPVLAMVALGTGFAFRTGFTDKTIAVGSTVGIPGASQRMITSAPKRATSVRKTPRELTRMCASLESKVIGADLR